MYFWLYCLIIYYLESVLCVCMSVCLHRTCVQTSVGILQLVHIHVAHRSNQLFLPPCGAWESYVVYHAWQQVPLSSEKSHYPEYFFNLLSIFLKFNCQLAYKMFVDISSICVYVCSNVCLPLSCVRMCVQPLCVYQSNVSGIQINANSYNDTVILLFSLLFLCRLFQHILLTYLIFTG